MLSRSLSYAKIVQGECKKPSLLEIFAEVQPILYKIASKIKANLELHKSLDDFIVLKTRCNTFTKLYNALSLRAVYLCIQKIKQQNYA
jgi:hypothetical protein